MKRTLFLFITTCSLTHITQAQNVFAIIDSVNARCDNYASFSYDVKVENIKDSSIELLDEGKVIVNNTQGKYDDFLFISHHKNDTLCFVKDTLLRTRSEEIFKDHDPDVLHVRLGTSQMFFRCFSRSFKNGFKMINPERWDEMTLDSTDSDFYYLSLHGTATLSGLFYNVNVNVMVEKNNFHIMKYNYKIESSNDFNNNVFSFSNWSSSPDMNEEVYSTYEKIWQRSIDPEYLAKHPTRKMRLEHNKTLSLDSLSIIDSLETNYIIGDIDKRYLVLYFWFQGCYHCRHVGPVIQKFHKMSNREDIAYLGVDTMSKDKNTFQKAIRRNQYDFPNYRYNAGVEGLTVAVAPLVIIYDNLEDKVLEQIAGGSEDFEVRFSKLIDGLPAY